jgi:hypothetical protein
VGRRNRINIFFIIFLTTLVVFAVLSKERDNIDRSLLEQSRAIIRTLLPPAPVELESDTVYHYVDADDSTGALAPDAEPFSTTIVVHDIGPEDTVSLTTRSISRGNVLISPSIVSIGEREARGRLEDRTVAFPVRFAFGRTGMYTLRMNIRTRRIHDAADGRRRYRSLSFPKGMIPDLLIEAAEVSSPTLCVAVEDTSIYTVRAIERLTIAVENKSISGAIGFEESNAISVSQSFFDPTIRILQGFGAIERNATASKPGQFVWRGIPRREDDIVVLEARINRKAGGKDVARTAFAVRARQPFLANPVPSVAYAGEDLVCDVSVEGLDDLLQYQWELSEVVTSVDAAKKDMGRGPVVRFHIPNNYAGRSLRISALYRGRRYGTIARDSYVGSRSEFSIPVVEPPVRIAFLPPDRPTTASLYKFSASMYSSPKYQNEQPVSGLKDVRIVLEKQNGTPIKVLAEMLTRGRFQFVVEDRDAIDPSGERVILTIRAKGATLTRRFTMYR